MVLLSLPNRYYNRYWQIATLFATGKRFIYGRSVTIGMENQDEVVGLKTVISNKNTYRAQQADSFAVLGTEPSQWTPCPIAAITKMGIEFVLPEGYTTVYGYFECEQRKNPTGLAPGEPMKFCQLCGWSPLVNNFAIQHDGKRLLMWVGSECVNNFMGAGYVTKQIKIFKETQARAEFRKWVVGAKFECEQHKRMGWIEYPYYTFRNKLNKIVDAYHDDVNKLSSRKIKNLFKKANELGIKTLSLDF